MKLDQELGVKKTGLSAMVIGVGGSMVGLGSGVFNLTEALLLVVAVAETTQATFNYLEK
jgi:hypothetical protein